MEGNGPSYSPGRVDQYFYELYNKDVTSGEITVAQALELIETFYIKCAETTWFLSENAVMYFAGYQPFHSLIVGGIDKHGRDVTNELSYLFLTAKMDVKLHGPSVCVRVHQQSPDAFIRWNNGRGEKLSDGRLCGTFYRWKNGQMVRWGTL